ncbi:iron ABC transporter permease [Lactobacillus sp. LC28-10]|uniref:Iron ABC transporter permease n=1 Tax=Secundilactobacillus angelensis TaxID=2722706 RepID=A0ABX1KYK5_9LACO|nr:iron ABC transporter permease [Secundilactobacillus angelensis]MCH5461593.1 iron ABC transporter permease [Secundilactobacillus angelensis]NLR17888.1 iron ABC transporter permease [Secundilactobacillus angelensis]
MTIKYRNGWILFLSGCLFILAMLLLLSVGDIQLSFGQVVSTLLGVNRDYTANFVVWQLRFPNLIAALITGGALAVSGLILQVTTGNSLADSSILGINAGASLGAVVLTAISTSMKLLPLATLIGAMISCLLVMLANRHDSTIQVLLGGVALTAVMNGLILILEMQMNQFSFDKALIWLSGSFWNLDAHFLSINGVAYMILLLITVLLAPVLSSLTLGSEMAMGIGVNVRVGQRTLLLLAVGLATVAVSVGGAISFVGLMAPNIAKRLVGQRIRVMLPLSWLLGTSLMMLADVVANNAFGKVTLPVGLIVAVVTMPYFILQLFSWQKITQ